MSIVTKEQVDRALAAVPGWDFAMIQARPLVGGLLNSNWLVEYGAEKFVMKVFGVGSENFVDRDLSNKAAAQAQALGISPSIKFYDPAVGAEMFTFLEGYRASTSADFVRGDFLQGVVGLYEKFNKGQPLPATKTVFDMTDEHIEQGNEVGAIRPADFPWLLHQYTRAKDAFVASGLDLAPCHNDPMPGNFMVRMAADGGIQDMKLIDFEFASNNERAYELGVFVGEVFVDEEDMLPLVEQFYGTARPDLVARVWVQRAVADMKWGSWAVQQRQLSDWDFDYQKYGIWKYARARSVMDDPRWNDWLRRI
jgi:thiamine kinase-like enzyme